MQPEAILSCMLKHTNPKNAANMAWTVHKSSRREYRAPDFKWTDNKEANTAAGA